MREDAALSYASDRLGYRFRDPGLLCLALTHPSVTGGSGGDNQRLEFLGDAVLELCVSEALFKRHGDMREGDLTFLRAALVREESLAEAARKFGIGQKLTLDHGEEGTGGRDKPSVLADALEAVLGAIYLDGGLEASKAFCDRIFGDYAAQRTEPNWKSALQEREQAERRAAPAYTVLAEDGPPHARVFTVEARTAAGQASVGKGASKKQAEQEAARRLLEGGAGDG